MPSFLAVVGVAVVMGAAACGADQPAVCDSLDAVQITADHIRDANMSENGVTQLQTYLQQLRPELDQLYSDAQAQFATEATTVRTAVDQFAADVAAARATPNVATLSAVRTSVTGVQESMQVLRNAVSGTC
jgi:hypothetical protein